jgi:hypothetical protein
MLVRELKSIGPYAKNKKNKYIKRSLLFFVPFIILFLTTKNGLPSYIELGEYTTLRGIFMGMLATCGVFLVASNYLYSQMGLIGERKVIKNTHKNLGDKYSLFNDVSLKKLDGKPGGNIDHIVIGPTGVFAIETKHTSKTVGYDGKNWSGFQRNPSNQAKRNAARLRDFLWSCTIFNTEERGEEFRVRAILAFSNNNNKFDPEKNPIIKDCTILKVKNSEDTSLANFISGKGYQFSNDEIFELEEYLKKVLDLPLVVEKES